MCPGRWTRHHQSTAHLRPGSGDPERLSEIRQGLGNKERARDSHCLDTFVGSPKEFVAQRVEEVGIAAFYEMDAVRSSAYHQFHMVI